MCELFENHSYVNQFLQPNSVNIFPNTEKTYEKIFGKFRENLRKTLEHFGNILNKFMKILNNISNFLERNLAKILRRLKFFEQNLF